MDLSFLVIVRRAVQFNRKFLRGAIEIQDVRADAMLAPEFAPLQLTILKVSPKERFLGSQMRAQVPASAFLGAEIVQAHGGATPVHAGG